MACVRPGSPKGPRDFSEVHLLLDLLRMFFLAVSLYWLVFFSLYFFSWKEKVNKKFKDAAIAPRARPCRGTTITQSLSRGYVILSSLALKVEVHYRYQSI